MKSRWNDIRKYITHFIIFTFIIMVIHSSIAKFILKQRLNIWIIYSFLIPISAIFLVFYIQIYYKYPRYVGLAYIISGLIKMANSLFFLYYIIKIFEYSRKYLLIQYIVAYFGILFIEVFLLVNILTKKPYLEKRK